MANKMRLGCAMRQALAPRRLRPASDHDLTAEGSAADYTDAFVDKADAASAGVIQIITKAGAEPADFR